MANVLKHRFTSAKADGADATQVQPSHWNDGHLFTGGAAGQVLTRDPTDATYGAIWTTPATPPAATDTVLLPTTTGTVHDWAPGLAGHTFIEWIGAADVTITGLAGGVSGQRVTIANHGTGNAVLRLAHLSTGSAAGNRFKNMATSAPTPLGVSGSATYIYGQDGGTGTWILLAHDSGAAITPIFSAADYTASSGAWQVDAGDVLTCRYRLMGRLYYLSLYINASNVTTATIALYRTIPGGFLHSSQSSTVDTRLNDAGGPSVTGVAVLGPSPALIAFYPSVAAASLWTATSGQNTTITLNLICEVI